MKNITLITLAFLCFTSCSQEEKKKEPKEKPIFDQRKADGYKDVVKSVTIKYYATCYQVGDFWEEQPNSFAYTILQTYDEHGQIIKDRYASMITTNSDTIVNDIFYKYEQTDSGTVAYATAKHVDFSLVKTFQKTGDNNWEITTTAKDYPSKPLEEKHILLSNNLLSEVEYWRYDHDTATQQKTLYSHYKEAYRYKSKGQSITYSKEELTSGSKIYEEQHNIVEKDKHGNPITIIITTPLGDQAIKRYTYEYFN